MSHGYHTFAPLDLPDEIAGIEAVTSHFSSLPQVACFDITARCRKRRYASHCRAPSRTKIFAAMPMN
jgi:acetate kinase